MIGYAVRRWGGLDALARRIVRNVGLVVGGDAGASVLSLAALALTARALGPDLLGVLVMIEAYTTLIDRWIRPETWQALIKYGTDALATDDRDGFRRLIKLGLLIDLVGALAAFAIAFFGVTIAAAWFGWDETVAGLAAVYCIVLIVNMTSTTTAILRMFDRFGVFAYSQIAASALRLTAVALAWWFQGGLMAFLLIGMAAIILRTVLLIHAAWKELRQRGHDGILDAELRGVARQFPLLWRFLLSANLSLLLRKTVETSDILIVGALVGPAASGGLHIAKRLSMLILKLGRPVQQVIYPDVSRLWSNGEIARFKKAVGWTNALGGAVSLAVLGIVAIDPALVLRAFAGEGFAGLAALLLVQMLAAVIFMFGLALRPALYSMEQDWALLKVVAVATATFYIVFFGLISSVGGMAASLAHCAFNLVWLVLCAHRFRRHVASQTAD